MKRLLRKVASRISPERFPPALPVGKRLCEVGGVTVALDFSDPGHRRIYRQGDFEPSVGHALANLCEDGDVFVDIGAHIGWHSFRLLSKRPRLRHVYCYEPSPQTFELLAMGAEAYESTQQLSIRSVAVGSQPDRLRLKTFPALGAMHSSLIPLADWDYDEVEVEVVPLDELAREFPAPPAVIKCDVEGAEKDVLEGARGLLSGATAPPPIWLLEANYETAGMGGYFPWQLIEDAAAFAPYRGFFIRGGAVVPLPHERALRHGDTLILAIPDIHRDRLERGGAQ